MDKPFSYSHRRWRRLRAMKLSTDPLCEMCSARGRTTLATVVDHKKPISDGGEPWDWDNLQSLCKTDHDAAKKSQEATGHLRGCDANGLPLDPQHPWNRETGDGRGANFPTDGAADSRRSLTAHS